MPSAWVVGVAAFAIAVLVLFAFALVRRAFRRRRAVVRARRALAGEAAAARLLEAAGYLILGEQVAARYALQVDCVAASFDVRADYIVSRGPHRFVAEVKTGDVAPRLEHAPTRRQLLEYGVAFDVDGVLLVDVEAGAIHSVALPWRGSAAAAPASRRVPLGAVFAAAIALGTLVAALR